MFLPYLLGELYKDMLEVFDNDLFHMVRSELRLYIDSDVKYYEMMYPLNTGFHVCRVVTKCSFLVGHLAKICETG